MNIMKIFLKFIVILVFCNFPLHSQNWEKIETPHDFINKIKFDENNQERIYLLCDKIPLDLSEQDIEFYSLPGAGFYYSDSPEGPFQGPVLDGYYILDLEKSVDNNSWYVSLVDNKRGYIYKSDSGFEAWPGEPQDCQGNYKAYDFEFIEDNSGEVKYLAAVINSFEGILSSDNEFNNCEGLKDYKIQSRNIYKSKRTPGTYFAAADEAYQGGVLISQDYGTTWELFDTGIEGLRIHCVIESSHYPYLYCGADSVKADKSVVGKGIYRSLDSGKTWHLVGAPGASVYALAEHPDNPKYMAAACGKKGLWLSADYGSYWEAFNDGLPQETSVRSVAFPNEPANNDGAIVYAGTFGDGLYVNRQRIKTGINDFHSTINSIDIQRIYPNPAADNISLLINSNVDSECNINIINTSGNVAQTLKKEFINSGSNTKIIDISNLKPGVYLLNLNIAGQSINKKFTVIR